MSRVRTEFERMNVQEPAAGIISEFCQFIVQNKAWWIVPIVAVMAAFGALIVLSGTGLAPFIYTIF